MNKKIYLILFSVLSMNITFLWASNIDTGWIKFSQPDETVFTGRGWGDEFEFYWETTDGYRFVKNYDNGYWCYAILSKSGNFISSKYVIGKVNPDSVEIPKHLEFSEEYKAEIKKSRQDFEISLDKTRDEIEQWKTSNPKATRIVTVDLILVEFVAGDVEHDPNYAFSDFNTMFASDGIYTSSALHPNGKPVFGSVHDYWDDMTNGDVNITGAVWNSVNWIKLDYTKAYYQTQSTSTFVNDAMSKSGYSTSVLGLNHKRAIIYAGNVYLGGGLMPQEISNGYIMAEEFYRPQSMEHSSAFFANIGTHCHELGHVAFGITDRRLPWRNDNLLQWCIMGLGEKNGPENELACPASLNPYDREKNS